MQCSQCGYALDESFRFCPECGHRLNTQPANTTVGNPPEQLVHQEREGKRNQSHPGTDANSSSEHSTIVREKGISNPGLTLSLPDTNQSENCSAFESPQNGISTGKEHVPQDGASLSSEKAIEETVKLSIDTACQNTQISQSVQDRMFFQCHQTPFSDLLSSQDLPGNTRKEESNCSIQPCPAPPRIKSSSSEASGQINLRPDSKCQLTEVHAEMEVNNIASMSDTLNLKTECPTDDFSPSRSDNELQPVHCALSGSATQPEIKDQNKNKSPPSVNETTKVINSQSSTAGLMPPSCDCYTEDPDTNFHGDLVKAKSQNLNQQSSVPLQPSNSNTTESKKEETHILQCTTGQGEKQPKTLDRKLFGPYKKEDGTAAKPKADNTGNKQQTKHKDAKSHIKETNDLQKIRDTDTLKQGFKNALPQEKSVFSDQNNEVGFQEMSAKKKNDHQNHTSHQQQDPKDITIFFHAILSKEFNLDPSVDFVTVRSGGLLGDWQQDILKMEVTRDLGNDGFLVHAKLETSRTYVGKLIPYKYVIHKQGKKHECECEYEYIYKENSRGIVNRCLLIRENLLTQQGEWHQYDDIIYIKTPHGYVDKIKHWITNTKPDLLRGRYIAAGIMLDTISDILGEWSKINVQNFFVQLRQFFTTYSHPYVYEEQPKPWESLQYGEKQLKDHLTDFMKNKIASMRAKSNIQDQQRAAVILLLVYLKYNLHIDQKTAYEMGYLLCLPKLSEKEFHTYWNVVLQPLQEESVADAIRMFCRIALSRKTTNWILVLPFLHFLERDSKPFERNMCNTGQEFDVWAGLKSFKNVYVTDSQHSRALLKVMENHKHLLVIDQLLVRSWMCVLGLNNLLEYTALIPVDIMDVFFMLNYRLDNKELQHGKEDLKWLFSNLPNEIRNQQFRFKDKDYGELCLMKCSSLLAKICQNYKHSCQSEVPLECLKLFSLIMDLKQYCTEKESAEAQRGKSKELFEQAERNVREWLRNAFSNNLLNNSHDYISFTVPCELEVWSKLISLPFANKEFCSEWSKTFLNQFEGKLKQERPIHQIVIYCNKVEDLNAKFPLLTASFENCALEAVTSVCQSGSETHLLEKLKSHDLSKFGKLISEIVLKSWPKTEDGKYQDGEELVIQHLLTWPTASKIFQLQGAKGNLIDQLSDKARELMAIAGSAFCCVAQQFIQGNITLKILNQILTKGDAFIELLQIDALCDDGRCKDNRAVKNLLRKRQEEVENIYQEKEFIACLLHVCSKLQNHIKVEIAELKVKHTVNVEEMCLDEFMEAHQLDENSSDVTGLVTYFNLCDITRKMAKRLHDLKDSYIFSMCWENQAKTLSHTEQDDDDDDDSDETEPKRDMEPCTLEFIHAKIFQPCDSQYQRIYTSLKNASITFKMVDSIFEVYKGKYDDLRKDLEIMCKINPKDNKRWIKERIHQIQQYHDLDLAAESAQVIMDIKETLCPEGDFKILNKLLDISKTDFLETSLNQIDDNLINAKNILADITEGRRLCLQELYHSRNFANWVKVALPDISQLKVFVDLATISAGENAMDVDRVACFHDVVQGYSSMLYGLSADSDFDAFKRALEKLWKALESDSNLAKKLRDSARHLDWLNSVKESHGSVELSSLSFATAINKRGVYSITAQKQKKTNMETALKLYVPEEHGEEQEVRCYSLEDVRDLQNKLMLMSGKAEHNNEVEYFTEVFDHVQRLARIFLDLLSAGNPLFRHWEAKINCLYHLTNQNIIIDFNLSSIPEKILIDGNVIKELPKLCKKMERFLSDWRKFMEKQRSENYYLNYYTAEQIVYLCEQLSLKHLNEDLDDSALMMLSFINPKSSTSTVWKTWNLVFQDSQTEEGLTTSVRDISDKDLGLDKLDFIWDKYMTDMKTFLTDKLDISGLGKFLENLNNNWEFEDDDQDDIMHFHTDKEQNEIRRELPKGLMMGRPNLIVCPKEEILMTCLSVYSASEYAPLPSYDEVLLCSSTTPCEHVELFLRRCLNTGNISKKIYTLLYGDLLSYEVSCAVEQLFHKFQSGSRKDYKLVIICSLEQEHAYIPSAFSHFKLHIVPRVSLERLQTYLCRHYTVSAEQASAATVFKERQCVGIVSSKQAGVGKSLYVQRLYERLEASERPGTSNLKCIRLTEHVVDESVILYSLLDTPNQNGLVIFHFDVTTAVQKGLHEFLFKLLVLGYLMDTEGRMWKRSSQHLYVTEMLEHTTEFRRSVARTESKTLFTDVFPKVQCRPPKEVLELEMRVTDDPSFEIEDPLMDDECFRSEAYQRPYQYLKRFHEGIDLDNFAYSEVEGSHTECLQTLFIYCGIVDPSWAELRNFAWFLNLQLQDCETSIFCNMDIVGDTLRGFRKFVVDFMILMAKDFATPSLNISDQSLRRQHVDLSDANEEDLAPFRIRKRWETEPHPYIFFNDDHESMTFIGFHLRLNNENGVDAFDPATNRVIRKNIMTKQLYTGLQLNKVPFNLNFDDLPRSDKIELLCSVLGVKWPSDPDETYQLTMDNILKMMAIHMRFRCGIPVIIMGETGCGKTRLIKFMCELQRSGIPADNMKLVKVHGGTTPHNIYAKVQEAETIASLNKENYDLQSVIFFDEANTTEAISCLKEVLCDNSVQGHKLKPQSGLQVIAACNPYRKHSDAMINRLEVAGLGYIVNANQTQDKLGSIPLRQLVYRVHALPPSMIPLVWDFGQLDDNTEKMYIHQIVKSVVENNSVNKDYIKMMTDVLSTSQCYMRKRKDECSFVSLRDVERCMQVYVWFYTNSEMFFDELAEFLKKKQKHSKSGFVETISLDDKDPVEWALLMAVAVCYHVCLEKKKEFWAKLCKLFPSYNKPQKVKQEISQIQELLLYDVPLGGTIAKNKALKENVFMMVVSIELRIPLFLVGKPGSSKSLAKTLVGDAMQGQSAHTELYRKLKQIHLTSYQCSPHSTAEGIINTFKQCARFQEGKNLKEYVSVVVLDEIGLAEDSPKMPLKTLHPLLEEGCIDDDPLPHKKVGFIGISNWALDPAKMNRGIFVSRGDPDENELIETATGICSLQPVILENIKHLFQPLAGAYLQICSTQDKGFFGLRDYYSLIKMLYGVSRDSNPSSKQIVHAVLRNFSGLDNVDALKIFAKKLHIKPCLDDLSTIDLVRQNITGNPQNEDCRYLLILTKNFAGLQILQQNIFMDNDLPEIIFGSSFPKDQEYTQVCRNINRVKICMETGQTVVLLNLQSLYESLYDALNQYYVFLGGQKYVDLGLGTHRVKCRVHEKFRLIVIEEKDVVYKQFPIPLINRLEKHYLDLNSVLMNSMKEAVKQLQSWVQRFVASKSQHSGSHKYLPQDVFIGYHSDTCSSVILHVVEKLRDDFENADIQDTLLKEAKQVLLNCATPDSVVRLEYTDLSDAETEQLFTTYFKEQKHHSLGEFIASHISKGHRRQYIFTEVTTFSRLLTAADIMQLKHKTGIYTIELLSLRQFETEFSFLKKLRQFLDIPCADKILLVQMDFGDSASANLLASARYSSINEIIRSKHIDECRVFVYFIIKLPRMEGGTFYTGFHGGHWMSVHIDDLRSSQEIVSDVQNLRNVSICELFEEATMETSENSDDLTLDKVFDTTALLRSCIQSSVGMLRDVEDEGSLSTRRVDILLTLLDNSDQLKVKFMEILKKRLHLLLKIREENADMPKNWVSREASNIDALQEGGTFKHTLWHRVQTVLTPFLAQLISVIDRNCNLDLLLDTNSEDEVKNLWLRIFDNKAVLDIPYLQTGQMSEPQTIQIQSHMSGGRTMSCTMPFSWRIKDLLDDLWEHTLQKEDQSHKRFEEVFKRTVLGEYFESVDKKMQKEFFQRYLQDFVALTMKVLSVGEGQLLCDAMTSCVHELCRRRGSSVEIELSLPLVHSAYHEFQKRLQNFSRMISILPQVVLSLQGNPHVMHRTEMVLDVFGALACLEHLELQELTRDIQKHWLKQVMKLQVPIEVVCSEQSFKKYGERSREIVKLIQNRWRRIFTLALFVEHVLLDSEAEDERLKPLVMEGIQNLGKVLEKSSDMKLEKTFLAVIDILRSCKESATDVIFRFGLQTCPICRVEPQDPVELPCNHIFCQPCIRRWLIPGQMFCALCTQTVPDDFEQKVSEDVRLCLKLNAQFRQRCNAFFIEVVSTICFKDNSPPSRGVILHLLSFLMVEAKPDSLSHAHCHIHTKALSPFNECVDRNPIIRSMVLKLLLKYSFDEVKEYLEQHLEIILQSKILDGTDKTELYAFYINCFEDSIFEKKQLSCMNKQKAYLQEGRDILQYVLHTSGMATEELSIESLKQVAKLRICLDMSAQLLSALPGSMEKHQEEFLNMVIELCKKSKNDWYRVYLIRKICSLKGIEAARGMQKEDRFQWLFPQELIQQFQEEHAGHVDQYLVYSKDYKTIREAVAKAVIEGRAQSIDEAVKTCTCTPKRKAFYILLALFQDVTSLFQAANRIIHPKLEQRQALEDYIQGLQYFTPEMKVFAENLINNRLGKLSVDRHQSNTKLTLTELCIHLKAVLLCGIEGLLAPLRQLAFSPAKMQMAFIPTMPEDMLATAQKVLGFTWYTCPNGHPCVVDKCGRPTRLGRCLECGETVGGHNHQPVHGFNKMHREGDRTQSGHILGDPQRRDNTDALDTKNMSLTPFTLVRMMTHLAMLLGALDEPQCIAQIIQPPVQDPCEFLIRHLMKDLEHLGRALGKGVDDTVTTVHLMLSWALEPPQNVHSNAGYDDLLRTKEARNVWEITMANNVIAPKLKKLEHKLKKVNESMREDARVSSDPILKLMYRDPRTFLPSLSQQSVLHSSAVWSCREKGSLLSLTHIVEQNDGKDYFPLLWRFLLKESEFRLVSFLPDILALERNLVKKFQNVPDLICGTIRDFTEKQPSAPIRSWYEKRIQKFLSSWNQLRTSLTTYEVNVPGDYCSVDLDENSELQVLIPRRQGAGLCATALLSYLVSLHNQLVSAASQHTGENNSYMVSLAELSDLHVIRYEVDRDLLPLVLSNCQYSMERGQETISEYDLHKIQQQVFTRFLQGKPQISLTGIPTLVSRQERNYHNILKEIREKVSQESLTSLSSSGLISELQSLSDVCETLSAMEVALGFLAMTGGDEHMPLEEYLETRLHMGNQTAPHILKTLGRCSLKHCVALWQLLTSLKSEHMLRQKRDPFLGIPAEYKLALEEKEKKLLVNFATKSSGDVWLLEMHEFLLLNLKSQRATDTYTPSWSIKETLASYMERKNLDVPQDVDEAFPDEIQLTHVVETWRFIVTYKQQR
ncbi:E3 ubiquitin-protein ligase rnf213-alpha-like isoform X3 [Tachysurus fulvidraco]|uniref:E3 ubiquitin-protein ligase rnf213-alpha-like isoform X3 n=1 Tax=Tachysurus fulvidraco TaxID=1234273 RepID=UPI001FEFEB97|nr:E3 ubiquitin-protein ligase rnf213-alpha-like isoform X3 [Tachysurus fulvidraco]